MAARMMLPHGDIQSQPYTVLQYQVSSEQGRCTTAVGWKTSMEPRDLTVVTMMGRRRWMNG